MVVFLGNGVNIVECGKGDKLLVGTHVALIPASTTC